VKLSFGYASESLLQGPNTETNPLLCDLVALGDFQIKNMLASIKDPAKESMFNLIKSMWSN